MEEKPKFFNIIDALNGDDIEETPRTKEVEPIVQIPKLSIKSTPLDRFNAKMFTLVKLLSPVVIVPNAAGGEPYIRYLVENKLNREQVEEWLLQGCKEFHKIK